MKRFWSVHFEPSGLTIMVREGVTLLDAVRRAGIDLETPCGGKGNCKQCRVSILSGKAKIRADDAPFFSRVEITQGYLLACRTRVVADMNVFVPRRY